MEDVEKRLWGNSEDGLTSNLETNYIIIYRLNILYILFPLSQMSQLQVSYFKCRIINKYYFHGSKFHYTTCAHACQIQAYQCNLYYTETVRILSDKSPGVFQGPM